MKLLTQLPPFPISNFPDFSMTDSNFLYHFRKDEVDYTHSLYTLAVLKVLPAKHFSGSKFFPLRVVSNNTFVHELCPESISFSLKRIKCIFLRLSLSYIVTFVKR